ncbi:MAG: LacI family DNA-binding transcriptional regulator [Eubacteriales bacterium]|nr:LacI family DNA-binding transcriptional regulator [Eubacteriales bacterium]
MEKTPTIAQIATLANVSPASVSMILNERSLSRFSHATVVRVRKAAESLNYRPKHSLKLKPIRIVCPSVMNPYYATLIQGIQQQAISSRCISALYATYWDQEMERELLESFSKDNSSGIIFTMIPQQPLLAEQRRRLLPIVTIGDRRSELKLNTVDVNNLRSSRMLAQHLLELGHRSIAYVSTTLDDTHSARVLRLRGLESEIKAVEGATLSVFTTEVNAAQELNTPNIEHDTGFRLTERLLLEKPEVTAIVAINDMVAYGVLDALHAHGKQVPTEYSVCGFDNIYPSQMARVSLTTVDHSIIQLGHAALSLLLEKIQAQSEERETYTSIEYQSKLVLRGTTAPPQRR